ncbi:MAG: hypothetical protein ACI4JN_00745 [Ruminococcus sp.]
MNQERIMKIKMTIAIVICILSVIGMFVGFGLYADEKERTQITYHDKYIQNLTEAAIEIDTYLETNKDLQLHYNMLLSDIGAARNMVFVLDDFSEEKQKTINTFHYCLVKYPEQMQGKLQEIYTAVDDVSANLDKGYDEMNNIIESLDLLGV